MNRDERTGRHFTEQLVDALRRVQDLADGRAGTIISTKSRKAHLVANQGCWLNMFPQRKYACAGKHEVTNSIAAYTNILISHSYIQGDMSRKLKFVQEPEI